MFFEVKYDLPINSFIVVSTNGFKTKQLIYIIVDHRDCHARKNVPDRKNICLLCKITSQKVVGNGSFENERTRAK